MHPPSLVWGDQFGEAPLFESSDHSPVKARAEEFLDRQRRGEQPALDKSCRRSPELVQELRNLTGAPVSETGRN
jgi:hypothetical protein